jgi:hypothetical protein
MDQLERTDFLKHLTGNVFLTQYNAVKSLESDSSRGDSHMP